MINLITSCIRTNKAEVHTQYTTKQQTMLEEMIINLKFGIITPLKFVEMIHNDLPLTQYIFSANIIDRGQIYAITLAYCLANNGIMPDSLNCLQGFINKYFPNAKRLNVTSPTPDVQKYFAEITSTQQLKDTESIDGELYNIKSLQECVMNEPKSNDWSDVWLMMCLEHIVQVSDILTTNNNEIIYNKDLMYCFNSTMMDNSELSSNRSLYMVELRKQLGIIEIIQKKHELLDANDCIKLFNNICLMRDNYADTNVNKKFINLFDNRYSVLAKRARTMIIELINKGKIPMNLVRLAIQEKKGVFCRNCDEDVFVKEIKGIIVESAANLLLDAWINAVVDNNEQRLARVNAKNHILNAYKNNKSSHTLDLSNLGLTEIPPSDSLSIFENLTKLDLHNNQISNIVTNAFNGLNLTDLSLDSNRIANFPYEAIKNLSNLRQLYLSNNDIRILPNNCVKSLHKLQKLDLSDNLITDLSNDAITGLGNLKEIDLSNNNIITLPQFIGLHKDCRVYYTEFRFISFFENVVIKNLTHLSNKLHQDWNKLKIITEFKSFVMKIDEIADIKYMNHQKDIYYELAGIIIQMINNVKIWNMCIAIAASSLGDCGDAIHFGFLRMQLIANKLNHNNNSLKTLYENQRKLIAFEYVITLANQKVDALKKSNGINNPDKVEIGLAYLIALQDLLDITASCMLYPKMSHITDDDTITARGFLTEYLDCEDNIYESMLETDQIMTRFSTGLNEISSRYDFGAEKADEQYRQYKADTLNFLKNEMQKEIISLRKWEYTNI